jgi:hypothetical protein
MSKHRTKKPNRPQRQPVSKPATEVEAPEELREVVANIRRLADEGPDGWAGIAGVMRELPGDFDLEVVLEFFARNMGKEVLPLLRGMALEEDAAMAVPALKALPLLGTRAAGDILAEAYAAYPEGDRAKLAWQGVEALQARGINVSVPEPEGVRDALRQYQLREIYESLNDGVGSRETVARLQDRYGVWYSAILVWNDRAGVKDGMFNAMGQGEWRNLCESQPIDLVSLPHDWVRWQIGRARAINAKTGFELGESLEAWDEWIGPAPEGYQPPDPLERVRAKSDKDRADLAGHLGCLFHIPAMDSWAIEPADVKPWWDEWNKLDEDTDASDEEQIKAVDAILSRAANEVIDADTIALYRGRLAEAAFKLYHLRREHEGDIAAATALSFDTMKQPGDSPFFRYLVGNGLELLSELIDEGEDPEAMRYDPLEPIAEAPP